MQNIDENKLGYIAIGDAVLESLNHQDDISCESLIQTLNRLEQETVNDDQRMQILQGRSLLSESVNSNN